MILLLTQIWGFLLIAWLLGMIMGGLFMRLKRSIRLNEVEKHLRDSRQESLTSEKSLAELRARVGELEGIPDAERHTRIAAREELIARIAKLETDLTFARNGERTARDEAEDLRKQTRNLSTQLAEERNKPAPVLELTPAQADTTALEEEIAAHKSRADDAQRLAETKSSEAASLKSKLVELEGRVARAFEGARDAEAFKTRVLELEAQLRQEQDASAERFSALAAKNAGLETKLKEQDSVTRNNLLEVAELTNLRRDAEQMIVWKTKATDLETRLAEYSDSRDEAVELRQRVARLETELAAAARDNGAAQELKAKAADLETRLAAEQSRFSSETLRIRDELRTARNDADIAAAKLSEAEGRLKPLQAAAEETSLLRANLSTAEARLRSLESEREDTAPLKARIAELEARTRDLDQAAKSGAQAAAEAAPLRARVTELERRLIDAQRAQDEAAILRAQVAEMDGRLGQALRLTTDAEALRARLAALEGKA
jgi:chromosome segregation ATPase